MKNLTKFLQANKFIVLIVFIIFVAVFMKASLKTTDINNSGTSNSNLINTPVPTDAPVILKPKIDGNKLTSPLTTINRTYQKIQFRLLNNWKYEDYEFIECEKGSACQYTLSITYNLDPRYKIIFRVMENEINSCIYNNEKTTLIYNIQVENYHEVKTNFGTIRIGKQKGSSNIVVCQNHLLYFPDHGDEWLQLTNVGDISIVTPKDSDPEIVRQMEAIIANTSFF